MLYIAHAGCNGYESELKGADEIEVFLLKSIHPF